MPVPFHASDDVANFAAGLAQSTAGGHRIAARICLGDREWVECCCGFVGEGSRCGIAELERDLSSRVMRLVADVEAKSARLLALADLERREIEDARRSA